MEPKIPENVHEEKKKEKKPIYRSKDGFIEVDLLRGFDEIKKLFHVLSALGGGSFICGGYARWCASPKPSKTGLPGDVDIYSPSEIAFEGVRAFLEKSEIGIRHENEIAITYKKPESGIFQYTPRIQLIRPINEGRVVATGIMEEVLRNFDFTVVRAGIINSEKVLVDADFPHDETEKILRLKNIHCPISSTLRCMKYSAKGYWLPVPQVLKLFMDWDQRDDAYRSELISFIKKMETGEEMTKEEINELEKLMRRD